MENQLFIRSIAQNIKKDFKFQTSVIEKNFDAEFPKKRGIVLGCNEFRCNKKAHPTTKEMNSLNCQVSLYEKSVLADFQMESV